MKFIFAALAAALSFVTGGSQREKDLVKANEELTAQNNDLAGNLSTLHTAFDQLKLDDDAAKSALEASKKDLEDANATAKQSAADFADLKAQVDDAAGKSQELLTAINGAPAIPITVTDDGINHDTSHPANDTRAPGQTDVPAVPTDPTVEVTNEAAPQS